jgi:hypothetical protein
MAAWTPIKYTDAIFDEGQQRWISDAEVAEIQYTALRSRTTAKQVTARLIVRRVPDLNPAHQSELFTVYRYHGVFTNSPLPMLTAEKAHRGHAIIGQVIADLKNGPPGPPTVRQVLGQQCLAGLRRHGLQPHPNRRDPRVGLPRPGNHWHDPRPTDQRPGTTRTLGSATDPASTNGLALGTRLAAASRRLTRWPTAHGLTHPPSRQGPTRSELRGDQPARPAPSPCPTTTTSPTHRSERQRPQDGGSRLRATCGPTRTNPRERPCWPLAWNPPRTFLRTSNMIATGRSRARTHAGAGAAGSGRSRWCASSRSTSRSGRA